MLPYRGHVWQSTPGKSFLSFSRETGCGVSRVGHTTRGEDTMSADRTYIVQNDAERGRLRALVGRLSDADLARAMPAGWTVAGVLAHLAFWDQRILVLLEQWERSPSKPPRIENEADTDWINDASKPLLLALAPRQAAELAVAIGEPAQSATRGA